MKPKPTSPCQHWGLVCAGCEHVAIVIMGSWDLGVFVCLVVFEEIVFAFAYGCFAVLPVFLSVYHVCTRCLRETPGTGVLGGCEPPCRRKNRTWVL